MHVLLGAMLKHAHAGHAALQGADLCVLGPALLHCLREVLGDKAHKVGAALPANVKVLWLHLKKHDHHVESGQVAKDIGDALGDGLFGFC